MHSTGMFNRPAVQQTPQVAVYDINTIAGQFANWNFGIGEPYDQLTPQIAKMTINEIQGQALRGHPIRVGMFNVISENAFDNASFQDLVYTIIMRMGHGISNKEWHNLDLAAQTVIARAVKCCGSAMAAEDQQFMANMPQNEASAVRENAEIWNYLLALAQGQAQYVPFNQMGSTTNGLGPISGSTQEALRDARTIRGNAGAFVENYESATQNQYNNNAGSGGRYGRRADKIFGKVEGSLQTALNESGLTGGVAKQLDQPTSNYQARMRRPSAVNTQPEVNQQAAQAAKQFDNDVVDFSKPLETPAPVEQKPLFSVDMGGEVIHVIKECKENGANVWRSSKYQNFHPAWCTRTHTVRYFETQHDGIIIAVLQELTEDQKEIAMNYDAHAIDPTKGQPEPSTPVRPVRKEVKVLYAPAEQVNVQIVISKTHIAEEDVQDAIRSTRVSAEMSEKVPDAYARCSQVNSPVVYQSAEDATEDEIVIKAISNSKDFVEAASYIGKIRNDLARKLVNDTLVQAVNRTTECELGIGVRITDFAEDGQHIIKVVGDTQGALISEKLSAMQTTILKANVAVASATDSNMKGFAEATLVQEDNEPLSEALLKRVLFLQRNVCVAWVNYTDNELAIGVPAKGAAVIQPNSLGALYNIAKEVFNKAIVGIDCSEQFLITKDNVRYRLHRGLINRECYLLSKEAVTK